MKKAEFITRLSARFVKKTPFQASLVVVFSLTSQIGMMLASLLPLKVLILLGSSGIPTYFPSFMGKLSQDALVVALGGLAVLFLGVHIVSERAAEVFSQKGVKKIVRDNKKTIIYNQQRKVAESAYRKSTSSIAGFLFIALVGVYVFWFDFAVGLSVSFIVITVFGVALKLGKYRSPHDLPGLYVILPNVKLLSIFCFLGGFVSIVVSLLAFGVNSFLFSLVCLLLLRQGFNRLPKLVSDMCWIDSKKARIQALFYKSHVFDSVQEKDDASVWKYLKGVDFKNAIADAVGVDRNEKMDLHLLKEGGGNVFELKASFYLAGECLSFLVKKFSGSRASAAYHEKMILESHSEEAPSPKFVGLKEHNGYFLSVFNVTGLNAPVINDISQKLFLYTRMASQKPSSSLVEVYCKSSPILWKRLSGRNFQRVVFVESMMKDVDYRSDVEYIYSKRENLVSVVKEMPLFVYGGNVKNSLIWQDDEKVTTTSWESWVIEPLGSGWPISERYVDDQKTSLDEIVSKRRDCLDVTFDMYRLVSLIYFFDLYCRKKEFMRAVMLAPEMRQRLESVIKRGSE